MVVLGSVQLQGAGDGVKDTVRDTREVSAFQAGVVVNADAGKPGHFFPAEPGDAAAPAVGFNSCLLRRDASTAGGQELSYLGSVIHKGHVTTNRETVRRVCQNPFQQGPRYACGRPV